MATPVFLVSATGTGSGAKVNGFGEIICSQLPFPARLDSDVTSIYREYLKSADDSEDMKVDGSSSSVDFYIEAENDHDIYINNISFLISDASAALNEFGNIGELTNGCKLSYDDLSGENVIAESLKINFDFVRLCAGDPAYGDGATAFRANNVVGTSEAYFPTLKVADVFGMPFGIRIRAGSTQRLTLTVNDDVSGVDAFNVIAYGFKRKS